MAVRASQRSRMLDAYRAANSEAYTRVSGRIGAERRDARERAVAHSPRNLCLLRYLSKRAMDRLAC